MQAKPTNEAIHIGLNTKSKWSGTVWISMATVSVILPMATSLSSINIYVVIHASLMVCGCAFMLHGSLKKPTQTGIILDSEGVKRPSGETCIPWQYVRDITLVTQPIGTKHLLVFKLTDAAKKRVVTQTHPSIRWMPKLRFRLSASELVWHPSIFDMSPDELTTLVKDYHSRYGLPFQLDESHL